MQIIRAENRPLIPWKNGGGLTREIAVHFNQAYHDDFLWRLSMAIIDQSCPFSHFEGVDRTLVVLDGAGISLKNHDGMMNIDVREKPFSFKGEEDITATLIGGKTIDLNIMTRRKFFTHTMTERTFYNHDIINIATDTTFIICNHPMTINGQKINRFDCVAKLMKGEKIELKTQGKGQIFVIDIFTC